jgi:nitrogen regulatory protein PII
MAHLTETGRASPPLMSMVEPHLSNISMPDNLAEPAVAAIVKATATGKIGDGKIFLSTVNEAIRIRNQERGTEAL